jgi:hypothetical protein
VATRDDLRRIALSLPEVVEDDDGARYTLGGKLVAWTWMERVDPNEARVPNLDVIAVRVAHESEKELLIDMDPSVFFTEPHYDGYPAILVRLAAIDLDTLERILRDSWRLRAPRKLVAELEGASTAAR